MIAFNRRKNEFHTEERTWHHCCFCADRSQTPSRSAHRRQLRRYAREQESLCGRKELEKAQNLRPQIEKKSTNLCILSVGRYLHWLLVYRGITAAVPRTGQPVTFATNNRGADKSLARPGRKQANVSVRMARISFGALPCRGKKKTW